MDAIIIPLPTPIASGLPPQVPWQQRHLRPLVLVLVACTIGQVAMLTQSTSILQTADTPSYLHVTLDIMQHGLIFDPVRTPGYPAFLALIFAFTGINNMVAVVVGQTALTIASIFQVYGIIWRVVARPWLAGGITSMIALNLYFTNWERAITTEALAIWTVITLFGFFTCFVATGRVRWLIAFALWSVVVVLTRPFFVYLPVVLIGLLFLRHWQMGIMAKSWWQFALALALAYGLIGGYMIGNAAICGYFGLSDVGSVNLFGKVLEYHMQDESTDPQDAQLRHDLQLYLQQGNNPWGFPYHFPAYGEDDYAPLARFSQTLIMQHLPEFTLKTMPDVLQTLNAYPFDYAPLSNPLPAWVITLNNMSYAEVGFYVLLPVLLVWRAIVFWQDPASLTRTLSLGLALAVAGTVLMSASGAYTVMDGSIAIGDFYRLRAPMDWAMIILLCEAALDLGRFTRRNAQTR